MALSPLLRPTVGPLSPQFLKGAIITVPTGSTPTMIVFQYNPEMLSRSLAPQYMGATRGSSRTTGPRYRGGPVESISAQIEIDATDALHANDATAAAVGIHPQLSALALLASPTLADVKAAVDGVKNQGILTIVPAPVPLTLFAWGAQRIVPVRIEGVDINESAYDPKLNPIRATVTLKMTVLTYTDFDISSTGFSTYSAYQANLEALAKKATLSAQNAAQTVTTYAG